MGRALRLVAAAAAALICAAPASAHTDGGPGLSLVWPASGTITRGFGYDGAEWHPGIDIGTLRSLDVAAAAPGVVEAIGYAPTFEGYGNIVLVDLGHGLEALYAHLSEVGVTVGEQVVDRAEARPRRLHRLLHRHASAFRGALARRGLRSRAAPSGYNPRAGGRLAQLGEHQLDKLGVTGSSPVPPIEIPCTRAFLLFRGRSAQGCGKD